MSPITGDRWEGGSFRTIAWTYQGDVGPTVNITLLKGGAYHSTLATSIAVGDGGAGKLYWVIPPTFPAGTDYQIRLVSNENLGISTVSGIFTIDTGGPQIVVTSPNGGENWQRGTARPITWTYSSNLLAADPIQIDLYDGPTFLQTIASSTSIGTGGSGSYTWTIPATLDLKATYKILVKSLGPAAYADMSNGQFTISQGPVGSSIMVTAPNGGESVTRGATYPITWAYSGTPGSNVKIGLFKGTRLVETITSSTPLGSNGAGSYSWLVKSTYTLGTDYTIMVKSTTDSTKLDSSDGAFSIVAGTVQPSITITSPNGGESWAQGSSQTIRWTSTGDVGSTVKIELLKDGIVSSELSPSVSVGTGGTGSFAWPIPSEQAAGTDYTMRVTSTSDAAYTDVSNANFAITAGTTTPTITVTSPDGGEIWARGSTHTVTWTYTGNPGSTVSVMLLRGSTNAIVSTSTAPLGSSGSGSYSWTIPTSVAAGTTYKIGVKSTTQSTVKDTSSRYFTIS